MFQNIQGIRGLALEIPEMLLSEAQNECLK